MTPDPPSISVLCVDDDTAMVDLTAVALERAVEGLSVTTATSAQAGLRLIEETTFDCIVSDYDMPRMDGLEFLRIIRSEQPRFPFILFTGHGSERIASEAIGAGVTDYMPKGTEPDQYRVLARRIRNAVEQDRSHHEATESESRTGTILSVSPDAIVGIVQGKCVYANPAAVELFALEDEAAIHGREIAEFLQYSGELAEGGRSTRGTGAPTLERERRAVRSSEGNSVSAGIATGQSVSDGADGVVTIVRDVSRHGGRERELNYRESLIESLFETSPDGILVTDEKKEILVTNETFADLWDVPDGVIQGTSDETPLEYAVTRVEDPESFVRNVEKQYERPHEPHRHDVRLCDGTVLDQFSNTVRDDHGALEYVWFYRDVTELKTPDRTHQ
ncbi:response regulator [Salinadaptatus halalkaliphilus]|uniref:Response regulator n=1 Tax=Salinadaptatus halalkaliphilus TaxID=2419781 RepID=A0A4S3TK33_9EURY|nr:response regulator [Salinadaptatus halalkaliphilus]THE64454.1 response regulator [Salinadaptatus halalkaliphilus]